MLKPWHNDTHIGEIMTLQDLIFLLKPQTDCKLVVPCKKAIILDIKQSLATQLKAPIAPKYIIVYKKANNKLNIVHDRKYLNKVLELKPKKEQTKILYFAILYFPQLRKAPRSSN